MTKRLLSWAALFGFFSVALGALGSHTIKDLIQPDHLITFETGVRYQFYHAIAIIAAALLFERFGLKNFYRAGIAFSIGIVLFSGSLYLLACRELLGIEHINILGPITPLGGLFFLFGWLMLLSGTLKIKN